MMKDETLAFIPYPSSFILSEPRPPGILSRFDKHLLSSATGRVEVQGRLVSGPLKE